MNLITRNPLIARNPFALLNELQRDAGRLFAGNDNGTALSNTDWIPATDIHEDKDGYHISVDLPGIKPEDIEVTAHAGVLSIRGTRQSVHHDKEQRRSEQVFGSFRREFTMPESADLDNVEAKTKDGVLEIRVPRVPKAEPRRISVQ